MCYPVKCDQCGKTGWGGCGEHVDQVMAGVPQNQRCTCEPAAPAPAAGGGLFRSLFGR